VKKLAAWFWHWPTSAKFAALAAVLFAVFAFLNDTTATIHLGFGRVEMPHYVALLVAAAFGFAPGVWFGIAFARREAKRRAATAAAAAAEQVPPANTTVEDEPPSVSGA
jgi:uncharacterized integral membrane protein